MGVEFRMKNFKKSLTTFILCIFSICLVSCGSNNISLNTPITKKTDDYNFTITFKTLEIKEIEYTSTSSSSSSSETKTQNMYVVPIEVTNNLEDKKSTFVDTTINEFLYSNSSKLKSVEIYVRDKESGTIVGEPNSLMQYENINDGTALSHTKIDLKSKETKIFYLPLIMKSEETDLSKLELVYKDSESNKYVAIS